VSTRNHSLAKTAIPVSFVVFFLLLSTRFWGIPLDDDSLYMHDGTQMGLSWLITHHDWGALYGLWFKLLAVFCHDPIARFFLSWALLVSLVALIPLLFKTPAAWLYTLIILTLPLATEGPYVGLFASAILLTGLCWLLRRRLSFAESAFAACILSFCVSFARPEYTVCVFLCAAATTIALIVERLTAHSAKTTKPIPSSRTSPWLMLLIAVGLSATAFVLMRLAPSQRSGMAFAQHFNMRSAFRGEIPLGPDSWRSNYAELRFGIDTTHNAGNGVATLGQFIRANPRLVLRQVLDNLADSHVILLLLYTLAVILLPWLRKDARALRPASLFVFLLALPPLAGSIIIFPHTHYAAILVPSLTLFGLQALSAERWPQPSMPWILIPGLALLGFLYVGLPRMQKAPMTFARLNLRRLQCVHQWDAQAPRTNPNVFAATEVFPAYIDPSRTLVYPWDHPTWAQFQTWTTQTQPSWISVDTAVSTQYGYMPLPTRYGIPPEQLSAFLNTLGYTPHPCSAEAGLTLYTHNN
jgi:uncharacterized membrane protein